jgi:protoporphyrinogen oxidase
MTARDTTIHTAGASKAPAWLAILLEYVQALEKENASMQNIVVLGTGMAGFGAAYRLHGEGMKPVIYDKNSYYGGHTSSFRYEPNFIFDLGPHISFTKDPRIQDLLADNVDQQYETVQINLTNYWRGYWPQHPVQLHLHGLPEDVIIKVIADFVEERQRPERAVKNYADWLLSSFGRTFAELFPMQYARKYHLTTADNMTTDWLGPRIYRPSLEEVLRGAISASSPQTHYITHFRYPKHGGFVSYLKKFVPLGNVKLNHQVVSINPQLRQLSFSNGVVAGYDALISSVPLPDLIEMIQGAPDDVLDASRRLACSTCVLVNVGVGREDLSNAHLTYFYDDDICFTRLSFPHMLSANNVPRGGGSIQAEVYFSNKYKPFSGAPDDWIQPVIRDLRRCGILREDDRILCSNAMLLPYANIIFDLDRAAALKTVHGYLDDIGIAYCGRYGDWGYMWTDESFKSGELAAEKALSKHNVPSALVG